MSSVAFMQVDVFTDRAFYGNPVAVILDASALDADAMQRIARWTNLSETTFLLPPTQSGADYRLRIFTPRQELPFAGHPSVGTAHAVLQAGLVSAGSTCLVQECAAGLLPLKIQGSGAKRSIFVRSPRARFESVETDDTMLLASALGVEPVAVPAPQVVNNGPRWWLAQLANEAELRALQPDMHRLTELTLQREAVGLAVFARSESTDCEWVVRCFCPADGIPEDPVTGSANACIAAFLRQHGLQTESTYRASQGREIGRNGRLDLLLDGEDVWVGGQSVTVIEGRMTIDD